MAVGVVVALLMSLQDAKKLAVQALKAALERDPVSGGGIDLVVIDKNGAREEEVKLQVLI